MTARWTDVSGRRRVWAPQARYEPYLHVDYGPKTFIPCSGPRAAREMWSADMSPEGYEALLPEDREWIACQWAPVADVSPDLNLRVWA